MNFILRLMSAGVFLGTIHGASAHSPLRPPKSPGNTQWDEFYAKCQKEKLILHSYLVESVDALHTNLTHVLAKLQSHDLCLDVDIEALEKKLITQCEKIAPKIKPEILITLALACIPEDLNDTDMHKAIAVLAKPYITDSKPLPNPLEFAAMIIGLLNERADKIELEDFKL